MEGWETEHFSTLQKDRQDLELDLFVTTGEMNVSEIQ